MYIFNIIKPCQGCDRDVAQFGSASALGAGCRRFKSCRPEIFALSWDINEVRYGQGTKCGVEQQGSSLGS